jgi:hypothetical protein
MDCYQQSVRRTEALHRQHLWRNHVFLQWACTNMPSVLLYTHGAVKGVAFKTWQLEPNSWLHKSNTRQQIQPHSDRPQSTHLQSTTANYWVTSMKLQRNLHNNNLKVTHECSHNLMRVPYKVLDHHLHHKSSDQHDYPLTSQTSAHQETSETKAPNTFRTLQAIEHRKYWLTSP